jgi:hypothetical protein
MDYRLGNGGYMDEMRAVSIAASRDYVEALNVIAKRRSNSEGRKVRIADVVREAVDKAYPEIDSIINESASFFGANHRSTDRSSVAE